jgi:uncharacterized membrane protein
MVAVVLVVLGLQLHLALDHRSQSQLVQVVLVELLVQWVVALNPAMVQTLYFHP